VADYFHSGVAEPMKGIVATLCSYFGYFVERASEIALPQLQQVVSIRKLSIDGLVGSSRGSRQLHQKFFANSSLASFLQT